MNKAKSGVDGTREREDPENQTVNPVDNTGVARTGGVLGLAGAIGAPARSLGIGRSIWNGFHGCRHRRSLRGSRDKRDRRMVRWRETVAAGGLGITAAPFVLSGIGTVVGLGIIGIAALIAKG